MDLRSQFYTIFKSLNPYSYPELAERKFWAAMKYFLFITLLSIVIMFILFIPTIYSTGSYVSENVAHFENLTVSQSFTLKESFNLLSNPVVRFDNNEENLTNELVLINSDKVAYKQYLIFGRQIDMPFGIVDVTTSSTAQRIITLGIIFMLPSLLFWGTFLLLIYFAIIIFITFIIGMILSGIFRINIYTSKVFKSAMYASTPFMLIQLILMPFYRIFWFPLIVYWVLFLLVLFTLRDKAIKREEKSKGWPNDSSKKDIWSRHEDGYSVKPKVPVQDSYDVDEHGNLRSSSKKHKSFTEDDDFVEIR